MRLGPISDSSKRITSSVSRCPKYADAPDTGMLSSSVRTTFSVLQQAYHRARATARVFSQAYLSKRITARVSWQGYLSKRILAAVSWQVYLGKHITARGG